MKKGNRASEEGGPSPRRERLKHSGYVLTTIIESNIAESALFGNQSLAAFAPLRAHALALVVASSHSTTEPPSCLNACALVLLFLSRLALFLAALLC